MGGFEVDLPIFAMDGPRPVSATTLSLAFIGDQSKRRDWRIPSQRPDTAYALWRKGRGCPDVADTANVDAFLLIARDDQGDFHARWLAGEDLELVPPVVAERIRGQDVAVVDLNPPAGDPPRTMLEPRGQELLQHLLARNNLLLYGPPGSGKTHLMRQLLEGFRDAHRGVYLDTARERHFLVSRLNAEVGWVTFHQSYSYEEFVIGLRPEPGQTNKILDLQPRPGLLLDLAESARDFGRSSLLVIDEINRGNASRIFGEFITLLEADKRLGEDGNATATTVTVQLPYLAAGSTAPTPRGGSVRNPYAMPRRLHVLASMNSVDKSVAPIDAALRRRFLVVPVPPDLEDMKHRLGLPELVLTEPFRVPSPPTTAEHVRTLALALLKGLNDAIAVYLGPEFRMGQWYLAPLISTTDLESASAALSALWLNTLLPQLIELFQGQTDQLAEILDLDAVTEGCGVRVLNPSEDELALGAQISVDALPTADLPQLIRYLRRVGGVEPQRGDAAQTDGPAP